jgi:hypothetical protein
MKVNKVGILISLLFLAGAAWILTFQFGNVWGNLEASYLCYIPTFVTSHIILHRKINKVHETIKGNNTNDNRPGSTEAKEGS